MAKPRILRLTRPYESAAEYIAAEGWSVSAKRMILLDQEQLDKDTVVRFEVSLSSGEKLIRAEARVVGYQAPTDDRPGGPKVRFKRFGGSTKSFIQQVVAAAGPKPGLDTVMPDGSGSTPPLDHPVVSLAPKSQALAQPRVPQFEVDQAVMLRLKELSSRVSDRAIPPPENRESLLERLRERTRNVHPTADEPTLREQLG